MDLRYLEFLLAAYSWVAISFCVILIFLPLFPRISEITFLFVTFKIRITVAFSVVLFVLLTNGFPILMRIIQEKITEEIDTVTPTEYTSIPFMTPNDPWHEEKNARYIERKAEIKKQWAILFNEVTDSPSTAAFAFIRYEAGAIHERTEWQTALVWAIKLLPGVYLFYGCYHFVPLLFAEWDYRNSPWGVPLLALMIILTTILLFWRWITGIQEGLTEINQTVLQLARLANMRLE